MRMLREIPLACTVLGMLLSARESLAAESPLATHLAKAITDCPEVALPNSMVRPPGFDLESHLKSVEARLEQSAGELASTAGIETIQNFLATGPDDVDVFCAVKVAGMTRRPEAKPILERYSDSTVPGVADVAREYLAVFK